ncbi:hypothetical protein J4G02_20605, partial [Candidatus Poribacteria bacterium]|nr:hypothetical protein [Candidatus Poribacteria bacterium]
MVGFIESVKSILNSAVADCFAGFGAAFECQVTPCQDKQFGDYQSNLAFLLAKREKTSPRRIAEAVAGSVQAELARPGERGGSAAGAGGTDLRSDPGPGVEKGYPGESAANGAGSMSARDLIETIE